VEVRVFRLPRKWMINPRLKDFGIVAILFSILSTLILFVFSLGDKSPAVTFSFVLSAIAGFAGVILIIIALREDPDFIHSFALCGTDELYHLLIWIPGREVEFKSFPDNYSPAKLLEKRRYIYSDVAEFICSDEFVRHVCAILDERPSEHPLQQFVIVRRMNRPTLIRDKHGDRVISYYSGEARRPSFARLDRHIDGYEKIMDFIALHDANDIVHPV